MLWQDICNEEENVIPILCRTSNYINESKVTIMKIKKTVLLTVAAAACLTVAATTAFAASENVLQAQQVQPVEQSDQIEYKSLVGSEISDDFGIITKDGEKQIGSDITDVQTATEMKADSFYGEPVVKGEVPANDISEGNVVCFNTQAEYIEHLRALEENSAKGLDRYAGFEKIYANIDTSLPITYIVK